MNVTNYLRPPITFMHVNMKISDLFQTCKYFGAILFYFKNTLAIVQLFGAMFYIPNEGHRCNFQFSRQRTKVIYIVFMCANQTGNVSEGINGLWKYWRECVPFKKIYGKKNTIHYAIQPLFLLYSTDLQWHFHELQVASKSYDPYFS